MKQPKSRPFRSAAIVAMVSIAVTLAVLLSAAGTYLNNLALDSMFHLRGEQPVPADIVIVALDEASFAQVNRQWPWPRSLHGELARQLTRAGARTLAFDIIFSEPSERPEDQDLADALADHGNVILASDFQVVNESSYRQQNLVSPLPVLLEGKGVATGFVNLPLDSDGTVRTFTNPRDNITAFAWLVAPSISAGLN